MGDCGRGTLQNQTCAAQKALIVSEIIAFIRTDGQTYMARSTRLVILVKNTCTLWGRKRFLLPVTYISTNLVKLFALRVTGVTIEGQIMYRQ